jgi:hypothetical protein
MHWNLPGTTDEAVWQIQHEAIEYVMDTLSENLSMNVPRGNCASRPALLRTDEGLVKRIRALRARLHPVDPETVYFGGTPDEVLV